MLCVAAKYCEKRKRKNTLETKLVQCFNSVISKSVTEQFVLLYRWCLDRKDQNAYAGEQTRGYGMTNTTLLGSTRSKP